MTTEENELLEWAIIILMGILLLLMIASLVTGSLFWASGFFALEAATIYFLCRVVLK